MGNWYSDKAAQDGVAVSTRIRLARNLSGIPFPSVMTLEQREDLKQRVKTAVKESNLFPIQSLKYIDMADIPDGEIKAMVERHIISPEFAKFKEGRAIIISEDESICIMVGEEDHIRIQVILSELQLEKAYEIARQLDDALNSSLHFAFDGELGYLTECPTNLGTGLRASVMLHLPLTESQGQLALISEAVSKVGFTVRGLYGEGSKSSASLYQISNQITLGISEKNAIENLSAITAQLIEKETEAEGSLSPIFIEDKVFRALGTLQSCRILETKELINLISLIRLGIRMGIIKEDYRPTQILISAQPNTLMQRYGVLAPEDRDIKRAELVREHFK